MLKTKIQEATFKLMVTKFGDSHLGLQMNDIEKIVRTPEMKKSGGRVSVDGVVRSFLYSATWGQRNLMLFDLHEKIYATRNPGSGYTAILNLTAESGAQYALEMLNLPTILPIPKTAVRPIPTEEGDRQALSLASHFAVIEQPKGPVTIFIVDTQRLFQLSSMSTPRSL
jgi:hypothetical protein